VQLSGGEKQRLALARALYKQADAVFVDEPTASLDAGNRDHMIDLLGTVRDQGRTLVIATHDDAVAGAANNVYDVLNRAFIKGGVVPAGSSSGTV
jgi:putative ABC transport system ATP-binding protein